MSLGREEINRRFGYHQSTSDTAPKHEQVREAFKAFGEFLDLIVPDGRAKSSAFINLQQASMWANFGIAELAPVVDVSTKPIKTSAPPVPSPPPTRVTSVPVSLS